MPADVLAPNGARPSAGTVLTSKLDICSSRFLRLPWFLLPVGDEITLNIVSLRGLSRYRVYDTNPGHNPLTFHTTSFNEPPGQAYYASVFLWRTSRGDQWLWEAERFEHCWTDTDNTCKSVAVFPRYIWTVPWWGIAEKEGSVQSNSLSQWMAKKCFIDPIPRAESTCVEYRWTERIEAETKWPPFRRRHFQMHFPEWKRLNLD